MKNKKGQYYLIAAMVIITILSVLISTSNYSKIKTQGNINKEGESLQIESEKLMDYIIFNKEDKIEDFMKDYSNYLGESYRIYFITKKDGTLKAYDDEGNEMNKNNLIEKNEKAILQVPIEKNELTNYSFNLKRGNNLYYIIIKEKEGEKYTYSNEI